MNKNRFCMFFEISGCWRSGRGKRGKRERERERKKKTGRLSEFSFPFELPFFVKSIKRPEQSYRKLREKRERENNDEEERRRGTVIFLTLSRESLERRKKKKKGIFSLFLPPLLAQRRLQHLDQLSALVRLNHDVTAAEEAPCDVHLREGRPGL